MRALCWLVVVAIGCPEHPEHDPPESPVSFDEETNLDTPSEDLVWYDCIQIELREWGDQVDRCRLEVGFVSADDASHDHGPGGDDRGGGGSGDDVEIYGDCRLEVESPGSHGEGGPGERGPAGPSTGADVGPVIELRSDTLSLELTRFNPDEGGVLYRLEDCGESSFPFGQVLDVVVHGDGVADVGEFVVEDAMWFPGRGEVVPPTAPVSGSVSVSVEDDALIQWDGEDPEGADVGPMVSVVNETSSGAQERLSCRVQPDEVEVVFPAEALTALTSPDEDDGVRTSLMLMRTIHGPETTLPWGTTMRSSVVWELHGDVMLESGADSGAAD